MATACSKLGEVAFDARHDRFALGVAEADVIFDQLRALGGQHQARVEHPRERRAGIGHCLDGRPDDLVHRPLARARASAPAPGCTRPFRPCSARCRLRRRACDPVPTRARSRVSPSTSANRLASSPSRNSSMTIGPSPAASIAASASSRDHGDGHALARGKAVRLDHDRNRELLQRVTGCGRRLDPDVARRWECPSAAHRSLVKPLDPSSCAAAAFGPKTANPASRSASATPATSGASGPTTTRSIAALSARARSRRQDRRGRSRRTPPSAQCRDCPARRSASSQLGDCLSRHASASSRPPEPNSRMFMDLPEDSGSGLLAEAQGRRQRACVDRHRAVDVAQAYDRDVVRSGPAFAARFRGSSGTPQATAISR